MSLHPVPVHVDDTIEFLMGQWELTRHFTDHRSGARSVFSGGLRVARLAPAPPRAPLLADDAVGPRPHVSIEERGVRRAGARAGPARRSLRAGALPGGGALLWFPDGRPFVDLDLTGGEWRAVHLCGTDHYEIVTEVVSETVVRERWHVVGPNKRYDATATFMRRRAQRPSGAGSARGCTGTQT